MKKIVESFYQIPCLTEKSAPVNGLDLQKKWFRSADKRYIGHFLQKFVDYNHQMFDFLGVQPFLVGEDQNCSIVFRTSSFIGAIPLRAPDTGKQIGDFIVTPRFWGSKNRFGEYIEILNLLDTAIDPEFANSLSLVSGFYFRPPFYLEAIRFVNLVEKLIRTTWQKFNSVEKILSQFSGQINWKKYICQEYKVEQRQRFPARKNILSEFHEEFAQIKYVFEICKKELCSAGVPEKIKISIGNKLSFLSERLYLHKAKLTNKISIHSSDSPLVKLCKEQANKILAKHFVDSTAWRIDIADVFEKFMQYILMQVSKEMGAMLYPNYKFHSGFSKHNYVWELRHIEPDAIFQKGDSLIFFDAKYKSHLYNKFEQSEILKEDFRHDLHQVIAYTSFSKTQDKIGFICYPAEKIEVKRIQYRNKINDAKVAIFILGIPLKKETVQEAKKVLINEISFLLKELH